MWEKPSPHLHSCQQLFMSTHVLQQVHKELPGFIFGPGEIAAFPSGGKCGDERLDGLGSLRAHTVLCVKCGERVKV